MVHISRSVQSSATRLPRRKLLYWCSVLVVVAIVCCCESLPTAFAKGYLDGTDGRGAGQGAGDGKSSTVSTSSAPAEILQLPHAFRHQQHYSHRIEQAVNDFRRAQLQQLKERDKNLTTHGGNKESSKNLRYEQISSAQQQPPEQHHRRHEHKMQQRQQLTDPQLQQHQLRHHNHHQRNQQAALWEQHEFPPLRHQQQQHQLHRFHVPTKLETTTEPGNELVAGIHKKFSTNATARRLFDRDPYGATGWPKERPTSGPRLQKNYASADDFDAEDYSSDDDDDYDEPAHPRGQKRISAIFNANDKPFNDADSASIDEDNDDDYDDEAADYSYEDMPVANEFPVLSATESKSAVKRFTNPFKNYKPAPKRRVDTFQQQKEYDFDGGTESSVRLNDNKFKDSNQRDEDNVAREAGDDDDDFSMEKWRKIEHEHHLKQQQHQRELQASIRAQHEGIGLPLAGNKFGDTNAAASAAVAANQQPPNNDAEAQNIFTRNYIPGALSRQKQAELGTLQAVEDTRRANAIKHKQNRALATAHIKKVSSEVTCHIPQRRVEHIQRDPSKLYTPHCTVLHRCAEDTGCCRSERQTCAPKRTKSVDLYFFVKSITDKKGTIERLTFVNHTECHCVDRSKKRPEEYFTDNHRGQVLRRATILNCNCPRLYEKILQEDGYCRCDCSSGNTGCDWLKRGMEHFSMIDRKCILEGRCKTPTCEFGPYIKKHGRCPRREEQMPTNLGESAADILATNVVSARGYH